MATSRVYLSHRPEDEPLAANIRASLQDAGVTVIDRSGGMQKGIAEASLLVVCSSANGFDEEELRMMIAKVTAPERSASAIQEVDQIMAPDVIVTGVKNPKSGPASNAEQTIGEIVGDIAVRLTGIENT